ncbi:MAG: phosphate propanoyltransferase [Candidatus Improbicoccus devescovinae]|nr:MAG: phosphate propanoyltransferase [Candidatus Improbicoccus devescovinae]
MEIQVEVSARHVHLSCRAVESIFGKEFDLNSSKKRDLSQPNQFLLNERVSICCGNKIINNVAVLGPVRDLCQVEITLTDGRYLNAEVPIRESGDLKDTPGCRLIGPRGSITLDSGLIVSHRHVHLDPGKADRCNYKDKEQCYLRIQSEYRSLVFDNVIIRVCDDFVPAAHIDTDEANAAGIIGTCEGEIFK